jgi:hypothetical protein
MLRAIVTRRAIAFAIVATALLAATPCAHAQAVQASGAGPRFRADGPEADAYGRNEGYPACSGLTDIRDLRCRVGAFSHFDQLFPARTVAASGSPAALGRAAREPDIRYTHAGQTRTLDQDLDAKT